MAAGHLSAATGMAVLKTKIIYKKIGKVKISDLSALPFADLSSFKDTTELNTYLPIPYVTLCQNSLTCMTFKFALMY